MKSKHNTFVGKNALRDFLNPSNHPPFPLVEIPTSLNPYIHEKVRIFAKLLTLTPLTNVKSLPAYSMLESMQDEGKLWHVKEIIESSSWNTVLSLAIIGRSFGIDRTTAYVSRQTSPRKIDLLRFLWVNVRVFPDTICPNPHDPESSINVARHDGLKYWYLNPWQYSNMNNPKIHESVTGKQIWDQTDGMVKIFCAWLWTTGTMVWTMHYLKSKNPEIISVWVVRSPNNDVPWPRTKNLLREIDFDWESATDSIQEIGTLDSYKKSLELSRAWILAWSSSGFALAWLLSFLKEQFDKNNLDMLRDKNGEIISVFVVCDLPYVYLDEYFERLSGENFPNIINEHLLDEKKWFSQKWNEEGLDYILPIDNAPLVLYWIDSNSFEKSDSWVIQKNENVCIVDIRGREEYLHFHLPDSENFIFDDLIEHMDEFLTIWRKKQIIFVCTYGSKSHVLAQMYQMYGIQALSLEWGTTEWSKRNFPRIKDESCKI